MKLFDLSNEEISTDVEEVSIEDIDSEYESIQLGLEAIENGVNGIASLEKQISVEENMSFENGLDDNTYIIAMEGYNSVCEQVGLNSMILSTETANLPSTYVKQNVDLRQSTEMKKSLITRILEAIKKMFTKLWVAAKKLQAKIIIFISNKTSGLENVKKKLRTKRILTTLTHMQIVGLSRRVGMYAAINDGKLDTTFLTNYMHDNSVLDNAIADIETIVGLKTPDSDLESKLKLTENAVLEIPPIMNVKKALEENKILDSKASIGYMNGKVISITSKSLTTIFVVANDKEKDEIKKLASRKLKKETFSLGFTRILDTSRVASNSFSENGFLRVFVDNKKLISFIDDMIKINEFFTNTYCKELDKFIDDVKKQEQEVTKLVLPAYAGVLQNSVVMFEKLLLDLTTTKRVNVAKMIANLSDAPKIIVK